MHRPHQRSCLSGGDAETHAQSLTL
jgi:hypothetical protein